MEIIWRESQYARSLIEASLDPLVTISTEGKITDMNQATINITGSTRAQLTDTDFFGYFTEPQKAREVYQEVFAKGSVADFPLTLRHKEGKLTDVLFNGSVYRNEKDQVAGVVIVARDVTDQKRIASELNNAKEAAELATAIAEEAKSKAESATLIAETAVKSKQQFLSNMSHEIRTPMNAIIGFTKVVLKTGLDVKQQEYMNAIKTSGDALIVLINDILDLAKVDAGKMTFSQIPFKLSSSISAMIHLFEPRIREKNLELVKEYDSGIPEVLVGDPVRLHQIILNLVGNAVKFTSEGTITVSTGILKENAEQVNIRFAVTDTGIGISETKLLNIFDDFQQATSETSRLYGGTGLGLAIVKQLVEAQGGSVDVKSSLGQGSTFSFVMNFLKTKAKEEIETDIRLERNEDVKNVRILVVEDIVLNQLLMRTLLEEYGFEMDIAGNGRIAIDLLKTTNYDIILMDLQMPEMNGFETTTHIRTHMNSQVPIIALTADVTTVDVDKCRAVGMNDYISKPIDDRTLYGKIIKHLKKSGIQKTKEVFIAETIPQEKKYVNLEYLNSRTKSNPTLMMEMIGLYLEQTPPLVRSIKKSMKNGDWESMYAAVHKMIPSFGIMGISPDIEKMAREVQAYANAQQQSDRISSLVLQIEETCTRACMELQEEFETIKNLSS